MKDLLSPDPRPEWLIAKQVEGIPPGRILVDQRSYDFTVVRHGVFNPELPYAVGAETIFEIYISENVPEPDREDILKHEIRETHRFPHLPEDERCKTALGAELSEVRLARSDRDFIRYIKNRTDYFNAMLRYYQAPEHAAMVTPAYYDGLLTAGGYINHIAVGLNKRR